MSHKNCDPAHFMIPSRAAVLTRRGSRAAVITVRAFFPSGTLSIEVIKHPNRHRDHAQVDGFHQRDPADIPFFIQQPAARERRGQTDQSDCKHLAQIEPQKAAKRLAEAPGMRHKIPGKKGARRLPAAGPASHSDASCRCKGSEKCRSSHITRSFPLRSAPRRSRR